MENKLLLYIRTAIEIILYSVVICVFLVRIIRFIKSFKNGEKCSRCNSEIDVERTRRSLPNRLIPFVESKNFVCRKCHKSFHMRNFKRTSAKKLIIGDIA